MLEGTGGIKTTVPYGNQRKMVVLETPCAGQKKGRTFCLHRVLNHVEGLFSTWTRRVNRQPWGSTRTRSGPGSQFGVD